MNVLFASVRLRELSVNFVEYVLEVPVNEIRR